MPNFRPRKFTFFPFLIVFKRIESIDMTLCDISFLVFLFCVKLISFSKNMTIKLNVLKQQ